MDLGSGYGHLTYATLVHPGDTRADMRDSVETYLPEVKRRFCPDAPMGVSLRLSGASVATLVDDSAEVARMRAFLDGHDLYVYTINAFPHGPFKGVQMRENVYEPDRSTEARSRYTTDIADLLVDLTPDHIEPTIQTAPLAFRANVVDEAYVELVADNVLRVVAHLMELEHRTGRRVKLALEPEPACDLETITETVIWFNEHIYTRAAAERVARLSGRPLAEVFGGLRRHLGVVFDICHQSVGFEDITEDLDMLVEAGIPIYKLQEAAALEVPEVTPEIVEALRPFTEAIYLSQTSQRRDGERSRFLNLEEAIEAGGAEADPGPREWRTHFHIPAFLNDLGGFGTTRRGIDVAIAVHARTPLSTHLEIETYTWDVLPEHVKTGDITEYVVRELEYVRDELARRVASGPA